MVVDRITINNVRIGMVIAEDVYNENAQLIVPKGATVNERILQKLVFFSVKWVWVYGTVKQAKVVEGRLPVTHSEKIRASTEFHEFSAKYEAKTETFKYELNDIADKNADIDIDGLFNTATDMLSGDSNTYHLFDMLHNMLNFDDSTYAHSLNVAMIANILGKWLNLDEKELKTLTVAGMLHDIGKLLVPQEIITKPGKLTPEEFKQIQEHTNKGYKLLTERGIDDTIARVALMHHEKCDGSGYPLGLKGNQISEYAKLITVVDIYEAMTANRVYRDGVCPFEVVRIYESEGFQKYDTKYLMTFLREIVDTYINNTVMLSDGTQGEIIMINQQSLSNPIVKVGAEFKDLSKLPDLNIVNLM